MCYILYSSELDTAPMVYWIIRIFLSRVYLRLGSVYAKDSLVSVRCRFDLVKVRPVHNV